MVQRRCQQNQTTRAACLEAYDGQFKPAPLGDRWAARNSYDILGVATTAYSGSDL